MTHHVGSTERFLIRTRQLSEIKAVLAGLAAILALAGCSGVETAYSNMEYRYRDVSLTDRCAHFAGLAFPELRLGEIKAQSSSTISTTTARVEGVNENAAAVGTLARQVAIECRFENGILTDFRWTAGPFR